MENLDILCELQMWLPQITLSKNQTFCWGTLAFCMGFKFGYLKISPSTPSTPSNWSILMENFSRDFSGTLEGYCLVLFVVTQGWFLH